jgi:hypothetical protein
MNTYLVTWVEQVVMGVNIEAESEEGAINKWYQNDYYSIHVDAIDSQGVVDNSIEAEIV